MVENKEGPLEALCILFSDTKGIQWVAANASLSKDALKALPTVDFLSEGIRITPCNMFSWIIR